MGEAYADVRVLVTTGKIMTLDELSSVKGRGWEDIDVSVLFFYFFDLPTILLFWLRVHALFASFYSVHCIDSVCFIFGTDSDWSALEMPLGFLMFYSQRCASTNTQSQH